MLTFFTKLKLLFTANSVGILFAKLFANAATAVASELFNKENQKKAYQFVKELNKRDDLTNLQKAKEFNKKMLAFFSSNKKTVSTCILNCLRELAVNALRTESQN